MIGVKQIFTHLPMAAMVLDFQIQDAVGSTVQKGLANTAFLVMLWSTLLQGSLCSDADQHLEMGNKMLAAGQLADALSHYHAAVEADPSNYKVFFRRATTYLAMGKSKSALPDLDKVISLKPDFYSARLQRGNVKLKQGKIDDAQADFQEVLSNNPSNQDAKSHLESLTQLRSDIEEAYATFENNDFQATIAFSSRAIELCPWDPALRELRAEAYIEIGELFKAIGDIRPTTKLRNDNTEGYLKLSKLHYELGEAEESLNEIRECLKLDADHKACHSHYSKVKKLVKQMNSVHNFISEQRYEDCVAKAEAMLKTESKTFRYVLRAKEHICHCEALNKDGDDALEACNEVLDMDPNNIEALCDRAEARIIMEQFEEAVQDYKAAKEVSGDNYQRVEDGLKRAEKLLKQSLKRDYYKILGVKRNANKREILKAYRALAVQWHPDKFSDDDEKKEAEKKFIDIAAAKEVLSDPELRQKFDNGEDPLDAEEQSQQGGHPFPHGFNPFGGGGFNFKFHFN